MRRILSTPRPNWQATVEAQGLLYHGENPSGREGGAWWNESAFYQFTSAQVNELEKATYALNEMCLQAVQHVIDHNLFSQFQIPPDFALLAARSWERDEITIYGRFDLAFDGNSPPKMLEYNADTPTALLEAAVIQWYWLKDVHPELDQFNSIHEQLIGAWKAASAAMPGPFCFTCLRGNLEDFMTTTYLRDTAVQAGLETSHIDIESLGWNWDYGRFVDERERHVVNAFKLYPWEWMIREAFGPQLLADNTRWLEAPWKMILSNKAILPVLWELFPQSPYLLEASFEPPTGPHVRKPLLGREGANIDTVVDGRTLHSTEGDYPGPFVYQKLHPMPAFDGAYPVVGSWMVNGTACGIGIREDASPITQTTSRFVPHAFQP